MRSHAVVFTFSCRDVRQVKELSDYISTDFKPLTAYKHLSMFVPTAKTLGLGLVRLGKELASHNLPSLSYLSGNAGAHQLADLHMNSDNVDSSIGNMVKENVAKVNASSQKEDETLSEKPPLSKKPKTCTSEVWKYFTRIGVVDDKEKAQCKGCTRKYVIDSFNIGTSTLLRHIPKCAGLPKYHNIGVMMLDQVGRLRSRQVDPKRVREVMSMAIIEHDLQKYCNV
ncbi:zinc finger BED domain-containing protein RICESLEEPER 2-like [Senna tora]|uniref:Zinc finger BED domain-containing protein RICESLEEPER 2-like n=1 Tax=Senna tora TaxID=362788 RepID=A0A834WAT7_9FABA|nr:zinc finger BED domain-containing protein RICESLEEPER 2-like [Senna tora]